MTAEAFLSDARTGERYPLREPRWRGNSGAPLVLAPLPGIARDDVQRNEQSLWRFRAALPLEVEANVTLGEGCSPLIEHRWRKDPFLFKLDSLNPTGSFKDKGASVMVSFLKQIGVARLLEDSSGNGGASIAAYGAAAGLSVRVLVPAATSSAKIAQIRLFGAEVQLVPGSRQRCAEEAEIQSSGIFYASHNWHPFFLQGTKMTAYELWEDLGFRAPDNIVAPLGAGSNLLGCSLGFRELLRSGGIARMPKLFGAQPLRCAPLARQFGHGLDPATGDTPSIAEGAAIQSPVRGREVVDAVRASGGTIVAVPDEEIRAGLIELAGSGIFVEPTSALAVAALDRLLAAGAIERRETTVILLTGSGLKSATGWVELPETPQ